MFVICAQYNMTSPIKYLIIDSEFVLNDSFFSQEKFKMTKSEFQFCPRWKQIDMRKKTGLF